MLEVIVGSPIRIFICIFLLVLLISMPLFLSIVFFWNIHQVTIISSTVYGDVILQDGLGNLTLYHPNSIEKVMFKPGKILKVRL
jgi:hypothetical protein